jgi:hypothetical protein
MATFFLWLVYKMPVDYWLTRVEFALDCCSDSSHLRQCCGYERGIFSPTQEESHVKTVLLIKTERSNEKLIFKL